jgi:cysteinyl-tRNA synthetase
MAISTFGPAIDLHAGGADLRFPHHAYEAAMAEAVTGVRPFARAWMHVGTVSVDGAKMAKSAGNLVLVSDLLEDYPAAALRLLLIDRPWAQSWEYRPADLDAAAARLERLFAAAARPEANGAAAVDEVTTALAEDLDVPRALAVAEQAGGSAARVAFAVLGLT